MKITNLDQIIPNTLKGLRPNFSNFLTLLIFYTLRSETLNFINFSFEPNQLNHNTKLKNISWWRLFSRQNLRHFKNSLTVHQKTPKKLTISPNTKIHLWSQLCPCVLQPRGTIQWFNHTTNIHIITFNHNVIFYHILS